MGANDRKLINIAEISLNSAKTQQEVKNAHLEIVFYFKRKAINYPK